MIVPQTDPQTKIDQTIEAEQRFLCLFWLDPLHGQEIANTLALKPLDFLYPPHRHIYTYCLRCAVDGWAPTIAEALEKLPITIGDLDGVILCDGVKDSEFADYGRDVQQAGDERLGDELRRLTRDTLKDFGDYLRGKPRPESGQPKTEGSTTKNKRRRYATKPTQWRRIRRAS